MKSEEFREELRSLLKCVKETIEFSLLRKNYKFADIFDEQGISKELLEEWDTAQRESYLLIR